MAKKVRMEDVDRISNLPDDIISHILSFLSTKEAVGTSILSTKWRNRFKLVTNLDFELDDGLVVSCKKRKRSTIKRWTVNSLERFVDRVLFLDKTSIEKFHLKCRDNDSFYVYHWISAVLERGVQHLDLNIFSFKFTTLLDILFTCRTLVTLKLDIEFVLNVPDYVCFPNLKTLHLRLVEFSDDDSVERLLSGCNSLEDMVFDECKMNNIRNFKISHRSLKRLTLVDSFFNAIFKFRLVIYAPMLVYLKYRGSQFAVSYEDLQSLVSADIDLIPVYPQIPHDATSLFEGISGVQSLSLSPTSLKFLSSCVPFPVFPKMVELKIGNDTRRSMRKYYSQQKGLAVVDLLLSSSPELEKIAFNQEVFSDLSSKVPSCLLYKLKAIDISNFSGKKKCIEKAKYFLENAGVVEKLTIRTTSSFISEKKKLKISEELRASPRKSKQCSIMIL